MGPVVKADFKGLAPALSRLAIFSKKSTSNKVTRQGVTQAAKYVYKEMRKKIRKGKTTPLPGTLKKSIGQKVKTYRYSGTTVAIVGPRSQFIRSVGLGRIKRPSKYAHFVERGRKGRGHYSGEPFLEPTLRATQAEAEKLAAKGIMAAIAKELLKSRK